MLFTNIDLVSNNEMYIPTKRKVGGAFLRCSNELRDFKNNMILRMNESLSQINLDPEKPYNFKIRISLPEYDYFINSRSRLRANDTSNFIKAIEDSVCENLGYNDRNNILVSAEKGYNKSKDIYHAEVIIEERETFDNLLEFNEEDYDYVYGES